MPNRATISLPVDPTLNVNALVAALEEKTRQLADAESKRIDQLAAQRDRYEQRIADMLMRGNEKALDLLAKQFTDFKSDVTTSIMDLQQKSWTAQGETKRGGDVWLRLVSVASILIAIGSIVITFLGKP